MYHGVMDTKHARIQKQRQLTRGKQKTQAEIFGAYPDKRPGFTREDADIVLAVSTFC